MNVLEARRARHLIIRLERGEELPAALLRALDEAEARAAWIQGMGSLEAAEIALFDQASRTYGKARRLDGPCDMVALSGNVASLAGESSLRLSVTLAREADIGLQLSAGELVWARVHAIELHVTAFDDPTVTRVQEDRTGLVQPVAPPAAPAPAPTADEATRPTPSITPSASASGGTGMSGGSVASGGTTASGGTGMSGGTVASASVEHVPPTPPQRPTRPRQEEEIYPDVGDGVTHFAFGECEVISSDGERIRLRQERDGRVREVSLTMLRIQPPTLDPVSSKRHFHLTRKN